MAIQTERRYAGAFILSEASGYRSRDEITIGENQSLKAGRVLGRITEGAKTAVGAAGLPAPAGATITAGPTAALNTKVGVHRFECIVGGAGAASKWRHTDPDGEFVGVATAGAEYSGGGLSGLTITDTGTDPTAGEAFAVTVTAAAASGQYVAHNPSAINGSQVAAGILYDEVVTGAGETSPAVGLVRDMEARADYLEWGAHDAAQKAAALAELAEAGIIVRS